MNNIIKLSLIVCTYNRLAIIKKTLPELKKLTIPDGMSFELIIVDNNSNDGTAEFLQEFVVSAPVGIKYTYAFEKSQGVSHARNKGFFVAQGDYIAYTDDECILPVDYFVIALQDIIKMRPAFLGGPYHGKLFAPEKDSWFKASYGDSYILQYKLAYGKLINNYLSGPSFIIRCDVFDKVGLFDVDLGMSGDTIAYGEEPDLQKRFLKKFPNEFILYNPKLFVWQYVREEKMSMAYLFSQALIRGKFATIPSEKSLIEILASPLILVFCILRAMLFFLHKLVKSFFTKEHFFCLLFEDYKKNTWRSIGGATETIRYLLSKDFINKTLRQ